MFILWKHSQLGIKNGISHSGEICLMVRMSLPVNHHKHSLLPRYLSWYCNKAKLHPTMSHTWLGLVMNREDLFCYTL